MSIKSALTKLHIVEDEGGAPLAATAPSVQPQVPAPHANYTATATPSYAPQQPVGIANPDMIAKIKASVIGTSPIINQFMQNVEKMKAAFPNDEITQMKAALASTQVDKNALIQELNSTVAAALLHTKSSLDNEHNKAHDAAIGPLQQKFTAITSDITSIQNQIVQLQQTVVSKQQNAADIQEQIHSAETNLQSQDNVVRSSFDQVNQYITSLSQAFTRI